MHFLHPEILTSMDRLSVHIDDKVVSTQPPNNSGIDFAPEHLEDYYQEVAANLNNIGATLLNMGERVLARTTFRDAIEIMQMALSVDDNDTSGDMEYIPVESHPTLVEATRRLETASSNIRDADDSASSVPKEGISPHISKDEMINQYEAESSSNILVYDEPFRVRYTGPDRHNIDQTQAALMFNLALNYHLSGLGVSNNDTALGLYQLVLQTIDVDESDIDQTSACLVMATLNNMAQIRYCRGETETSRELFNELSAVADLLLVNATKVSRKTLSCLGVFGLNSIFFCLPTVASAA